MLKPIGSIVVGQLVDWIWMFFNALIPLIIPWKRAKTEYGLDITINMRPQKYFDHAFPKDQAVDTPGEEDCLSNS